MKAIIDITSQYGFAHYWNLIVTINGKVRSFYLGQDVKFCHRVLGMEPRYIVEQIGTAEITKSEGNKKLAEFIVEQLGINEQNFADFESWAFCSE